MEGVPDLERPSFMFGDVWAQNLLDIHKTMHKNESFYENEVKTFAYLKVLGYTNGEEEIL